MEIVNKSNHKPNKLLVDKGREFYNKLKQEGLYLLKDYKNIESNSL